jgi:HicB_like antitoxin of bacterial toxin-antitoxin system
MPRMLLSRIDDYAKAHGISRSGFLAQAAQQAMRQ